MSEEIDKIEGICQDCMYLGQIMPIIKQSQRKIEQLEMTLRGTTHCFDEEEHKKLIEENKKLKIQLYSPDQVEFDCPKCGEKYLINYSRDVYDLKQENKELKKYIKDLQHQLEEKDKVINEILKECFYVCDCPVSRLDEDTNKLCNLLDCENCQENYKECWLKYFENKVLEGSKTT